MKKTILLIVVCLPFVMMAQVATNGDYRTAKAAGNWSDADMWEVRSGGAWSVTATAPSASNNVYVQNGHVVTVDVATVNCKDLQFNILGSMVIDVNTVQVIGKLRAYSGTAVTGAADGTFYSGQTSATTGFGAAMATTTGAGVLKIIGATRIVLATGEWGGSGFQSCPVEFNMTGGEVATANASFKFKHVTIANGTTLNASSTTRVGADDGLGTGNVTIKSGATLISARSSLASQVISAQSATRCGTVNIESGAILQLTGSTPSIDCSSFVNNGTVIYSGAGQTLLQKSALDAAAVNLDNYYNLKLQSVASSSKQIPPYNVTVNNELYVEGVASLSNTTNGTKVIMANNSTIYKNSSNTTPLGSTTIQFGTTATDLVNVVILLTGVTHGELPSAIAPGKVGTLTIGSGVTYTISGSRAVTNVVNNNFIAFTTASSFTFSIDGSISGPGTITGHTGASISFTGANDNNAGTLNFTAGSQVANNLTVNRTGTNASVTLGTPVTLSGNLSLTAGTLIGGSSVITVPGNISGSGFNTALGAGKIVMSGNAGVATISSATIGNIELNNTNGFLLSGSPNITGTLTMTAGNVTIPSTRTLRISSGNSIAGAPFSSSKYIKCEMISPNVGSLRMDNLTSTKLFPVGSITNYLPVNLTPGSAMDFSVNVFEGITQNGAPDGIPATATQKESIVDAAWTISRLNGAGNCDVELNWVPSLEGTVFTTLADALIGIGRYNGTDWGIVSGSGNNTINYAYETFNSFSPFLVGRKGFLLLPVILKSISASIKPGGVELNWKVENEFAIHDYIIERSINGTDFSGVGSVNASNKTNYSFTDPTVLTGRLYYRLKIVGISGEIKYSDILVVKQANAKEISLYPNPVINKVMVSGLTNSSAYKIYNANGQLVMEQKIVANAFSVDVSALQSGLYFIEISSPDNEPVKQSFIKQ